MPPTARFLLSHVVREINRKTDGQYATELTKTNIQGGCIHANKYDAHDVYVHHYV